MRGGPADRRPQTTGDLNALRTTHYAPRLTHYSLLIILLLAFTLRVFRLDYQELRGDEAFGYFFSLRSFGEIVQATVDLREPHPVASYFVQHLWLGWMGHNEFALRYLGVLFSVAAVAILYRLGRQLALPPVVAVVGALILAINPYPIWHSQDARMYSMSLCLTLASSWLMAAALQRGRRRLWIAYLLLTWAVLFTHYFAIFVVVAQNLFVVSRALVTRRIWFTLSQWIQYQIVLAFFYLPWLLTAAETLTGYGGNGDSPGFAEMAGRTLGAFSVGESLPAEWRLLFAGISAILLILGIWHLAGQGANGRRALILMLLLWLVPVLLTWYGSWTRPIFDERYLIAAAPAFYLLIAAGISAPLGQWRAIPLLLGIVLALGMGISLRNYYADPAYSKTRGWRELAMAFERFSAGMATGETRLAQNFPDPTIWYYYRGAVDHLVLPPQPHDKDGAAAAVDQLVEEGIERVILPIQPAAWWDGEGIAPAALAAQYTLAAETQIGVWPVQIYTHPPREMTPIGATFGDRLTLVAGAVTDALIPGGLLTVHLAWDGEATALTGGETVFIHLLDGEGQIIAQADQPLSLIDAPVSSYGILLPETLPTGPMRLIAGIYDPSQAGALRLITADGADAVEVAAWPN
ncbi:MAG: glycosyltransferase family 39 protein [Caldilineaceae bacterium]|nr:glycosyltransferase family 39 protein [Caldilineaceae bacterium]